MRILFLTYHFPLPAEPGAARPWVTANLLRDLGHEVTVITAGTHYMTGEDTRASRSGLWSLERIGDLRVVKTFAIAHHRRSLPRRLANNLCYAAAALVAGLVSGRSDVVLTATDPPFILPVGYVIARAHRARLVLDERDLYPDTAVALGYVRRRWLIRCMERWQGFFRTRSASIIAATPGIRRLLIAKGVPAASITVFPNVPDGSEPAETELPPTREFLVMYVGKFGYANEFLTMLRAAERLREQAPEVKFLLIGDGERKRECMEFCAARGIGNVAFLPPQPRAMMPELVRSAHVGIQAFDTNPFWECALSTKIFDHLLNRRPVVFAGVGDSADLIRESGGGIVVPPCDADALADALVTLAEDRALCRKMGIQGETFVRTHFSRDAMKASLQAALGAVA
jgi:glycosyltransferase involved in cell wall biosynthesis